jgi:hypothetical protein
MTSASQNPAAKTATEKRPKEMAQGTERRPHRVISGPVVGL